MKASYAISLLKCTYI